MSYYQSAVKVTSEGDVSLSDEAITGLGTATSSFLQILQRYLFGAIVQIARPVAPHDTVPPIPAEPPRGTSVPEESPEVTQFDDDESPTLQKWSVLTQYVPDPGYFLAGGLSGVASRTTTAPLDRLKVYLIANTGKAEEAMNSAKDGAPLKATQQAGQGMIRAMKQLWAAGGMRSLFAGMS